MSIETTAPPIPADGREDGELSFIEGRIEALLGTFAYWRQLAYLFFECWHALFTLKGHRWRYTSNLIIHQVIFSGIDAITVVSFIAAVIGGVVMVQMMSFSPGFQANAFLMGIMSGLIVKELAPLFTALILVGRSGSAITVELGNMRVKRQHEALAAMGIDIVQFFHLPRVAGMVAVSVILNGYFIIMTVVSWIGISFLQGDVDIGTMLSLFAGSLDPGDLAVGVVKAAVIGMTIALICIHQGVNVKHSITEIPQRTSKAIISSFMASFIITMLISVFWYMLP